MAFAGTVKGNLSFSNAALLRPDGSSEPELRVRGDGTVGMVALSWENFVTRSWSAPFGGTATFRGEIDSALQLKGHRQVFGRGDADVDLSSTGTLHDPERRLTAKDRDPRSVQSSSLVDVGNRSSCRFSSSVLKIEPTAARTIREAITMTAGTGSCRIKAPSMMAITGTIRLRVDSW